MYIQNKNHNKGRKKLLFGIIIAIIVVFGSIQFFAPHFLPSLFTMIARPFWRMEFSMENGALQTPETLLNENAKLKRQIDDLNTRLLTTSLLEQENNDFKTLLGRSENASTSIRKPYILAAVLKRPPLVPYDEIIIDIGSDYGVMTGNLVYAAGNILVGKVADVLSDSSKVELLSSPNSTFDIRIGSSSINAAGHGNGGGQYSAQLPRDIVISIGDIITAPSLSMVPIGTVGAVITDPTQPFETIFFAPPVGLYGMKWVLVDTHATSSSKKQ